MLHSASEDAAAPLRRRLIGEGDLAAVTELLAAAFPRRRAAAWRLAFERLGAREPPPGLPRYGVLLEAGGRVVGAVLTICAGAEVDGHSVPRCHLSCWTVEPAFAAQAALLLGPLLRRRDVTLVNLSPAPHTEATIVAQGFQLLCRGSGLVLPMLHLPFAPPARVEARRIASADASAMPEAALLADHIGWGCPCFAVVTGDGASLPFVFAPPRRLRGLLPASRLLYCRNLDGLAAHARALARPLLRAGIVGVLVDSPSPIRGLPARRVGGKQGRYWRGPHPPRPGDLGYSEFALFPD